MAPRGVVPAALMMLRRSVTPSASALAAQPFRSLDSSLQPSWPEESSHVAPTLQPVSSRRAAAAVTTGVCDGTVRRHTLALHVGPCPRMFTPVAVLHAAAVIASDLPFAVSGIRSEEDQLSTSLSTLASRQHSQCRRAAAARVSQAFPHLLRGRLSAQHSTRAISVLGGTDSPWRRGISTERDVPVQGAASTDSSSRSNSAGAATPQASASKAAAAPFNWPNALSIGRGLSGPVIAYWVLHDQWWIAMPALVVSGGTDWLDGYLARRLNQGSVLGSYLDPLGDKVLMGCVIAALAYKGMIPAWVAFVVVGRDVGLVGGMFIHRFRMLGWRWPGAAAFFSTDAIPGGSAVEQQAAASQQQPTRQGGGKQDAELGGTAGGTASAAGTISPAGATAAASGMGGGSSSGPVGSSGAGGVPMMQPLMISKINTVLQLGLVGGCMTQALWGWPTASVMHPLELTTAATTAATAAAYLQLYLSGRLLGKAGK